MECTLGKMDVKTTLKMGDTGEAVKAWQKALFVMRGARTYGKQGSTMQWLTAALDAAQALFTVTVNRRYDWATTGLSFDVGVKKYEFTVSDLLDGDFGSYTEDATKAYQRFLGLTGAAVDGIVGSATLAKHNALVASTGLDAAKKDDLTFTWVGDGAPGGTGTGGSVTPLVKKGLGTGAIVALLAAAWFVFKKKGRK